MLKSVSICHQGLVRERNEDSILSNEDVGLWVVADGVGGNAHGDVASQLAVQTLDRRVRQGRPLEEAISGANEAIHAAQTDQPDLSGMATTVVASLFQGNHFELCWIGDSRGYLIDREGISQITNDHNLANELFSNGQISLEEAQVHSGQHELTQALGQMNLDELPKCVGELHEGEYLLLCSDGLSGPVSDQRIYEVVAGSEDLSDKADALLKLALDAGGPDNISVVLITFEEPDSVIHASDFKGKQNVDGANKRSRVRDTFRRPFNKLAYEKNLWGRSLMLAMMLAAILFLGFFI